MSLFDNLLHLQLLMKVEAHAEDFQVASMV